MAGKAVNAGSRAAFYLRVSTLDRGQTTQNQELALRDWATRAGQG